MLSRKGRIYSFGSLTLVGLVASLVGVVTQSSEAGLATATAGAAAAQSGILSLLQNKGFELTIKLLENLGAVGLNLGTDDARQVLLKVAESLNKNEGERNHDIAKASRQAILSIIANEEAEAQDKNDKKSLKKILQTTEASWAWIELLEQDNLITISEEKIPLFFAEKVENIAKIESPVKENQWRLFLLEIARQNDCALSADSINKISASLHKKFPQSLREVFAQDFANEGVAYGKLLLALVGDIKASQTEILTVITTVSEKQDTYHLKEMEWLKKIWEEIKNPQKSSDEAFKGFHRSFPRVPDFFTGRNQVLEDLEETLKTKNQASFYGTHGLGKTRTAIEYAFRHKEDYDYILFISATKGNFVNNAAIVGAEISDAIRDATTLEAKFNLFIEYLQDYPNWLIICDNVEDILEMKNKIPRHFEGNVIYTSNLRDISGVAPLVTIEAMTQAEAELTLLRRKLEDNNAEIEDFSAEEREAITKIVEKIGTLPIGLNLGGAFASKYQINFREYLKDYEAFETETFKDFDLADYYGEEFLKGLNEDEKKEYKGIAGVFLLSYKRIIEPKDDTEREKLISETIKGILNLSVFLAPEKVPEEIWKKGLKQIDETLAKASEDAMLWLEVSKRLTQSAFFVRNENDNTSTTHRLILSILQKQLNDEEKHGFAEITVDTVNNLFPNPAYENWNDCNRLLNHAETSISYAGKIGVTKQTVALLSNHIALYLFDLAEYDRAVIFYEKALEISEKNLGKEHNDYANILNNLAGNFDSLGEYEKAVQLYLQVLKIDEKTVGKENHGYAQGLNNLALAYSSLGRFDEAASALEQAIRIDEKTIGEEHPSYANSLNNLGSVYYSQGKYDQAIKLYKQALLIDEKTIGKEHPSYATRLNNLALVYYSQGRYDEALELNKQALLICENTIGKEHPDYGTRLSNLALVYYSQGKHDEAIELYKQALVIYENTVGRKHRNYATSLNNLAEVYRLQDKYDEAIELCERALLIYENTFGQNHPDYASGLNNLALVYQSQGKYDEAIELYEQALVIRENIFGREHPDYATGLNNLAEAYRSQDKYDKAIELHKKALLIDEKTIGKEHPGYATRLNNLANVYSLQENYDKALPMCEEAVRIFVKFLGEDHHQTQAVKRNLEDCRRMMGKYS